MKKTVFLIMKKLMFSIIFLIFLANLVNAQLTVTKTAPDKLELGNVLEVNIKITNSANEDLSISVKETVAGADPVDPPQLTTPTCPGALICPLPPYYLWETTVSSNSEKTMTYKIKPLSLGDYVIGPTSVTTSSGTFYSNSLTVLVQKPNNGICEPELGENYYNNPEDCPSGSNDNVCDLLQDGRCDPDCTPGSDPDCLTPTTTTVTTHPITTTTIPEKKTSRSIYIYLIILLIIIAVIAFLLYRIRMVR